MPLTLQASMVHVQQWTLPNDRPLTELPLSAPLHPLTICLWINGRLVNRQHYSYSLPPPTLTVPWVLLQGDTVRVTGKKMDVDQGVQHAGF